MRVKTIAEDSGEPVLLTEILFQPMNSGQVRRPGRACHKLSQLLLKLGEVGVLGRDNDEAVFLLGDDLEPELSAKGVEFKTGIDFQQ